MRFRGGEFSTGTTGNFQPELTSALYRIYTEDEPGYRDTIIQALQNHGFPYFTLISAGGYGPGQDGKQENTVIIDVAMPEYTQENNKAIQAAAEEIRKNNEQQTILVVRIPAFPSFVTSQDKKGARFYSISFKRNENGKPFIETETAVGKILATYGEWEKLLGKTDVVPSKVVKGKIVKSGIVRFGVSRVEVSRR